MGAVSHYSVVTAAVTRVTSYVEHGSGEMTNFRRRGQSQWLSVRVGASPTGILIVLCTPPGTIMVA